MSIIVGEKFPAPSRLVFKIYPIALSLVGNTKCSSSLTSHNITDVSHLWLQKHWRYFPTIKQVILLQRTRAGFSLIRFSSHVAKRYFQRLRPVVSVPKNHLCTASIANSKPQVVWSMHLITHYVTLYWNYKTKFGRA